jgi:hypothetical protein
MNALTITSSEPFKLFVERNHEPQEYLTATHYTNHNPREGDWLRLLVGKDLYVLRVAGGASCFADYGRIRITGAKHAP